MSNISIIMQIDVKDIPNIEMLGEDKLHTRLARYAGGRTRDIDYSPNRCQYYRSIYIAWTPNGMRNRRPSRLRPLRKGVEALVKATRPSARTPKGGEMGNRRF